MSEPRIDVKGFVEINEYGMIRRSVIHAEQTCSAMTGARLFYIRLVSAPNTVDPAGAGLFLCRACHPVPEGEQPELTESVKHFLETGVKA